MIMHKKILYLGDTSLDTAASYLAGVMTAGRIEFDYLRSDEKFRSEMLASNYSAIIISDYPAENFTFGQLEEIAERVQQGMGLLKVGGWESFTGASQEYTDTPLKELLPVIMRDGDDRVNSSGPCLVKKVYEHDIIEGLPFETNAPTIGGFNHFAAKGGSEVILRSQCFDASLDGDRFIFEKQKEADPLLVVGSHGAGRVAAFGSDVAPHWVGGLVDWGDDRLHAQAPGAGAIEVGNWYASFFTKLVKWTANMR